MRAFLSGCLFITLLMGSLKAETKTVTWTGWFSDAKCAAARAAAGTFTATNPECAKTCIEKGAKPVFISEQAKAIFQIKDYPKALEDLGYHVEITGNVDEAAGTISVETVKQLSFEGAACARPKKTGAKQ